MARKLEEITATYQFERHRFENAGGDVVIGTAAMTTDDGNQQIAVKFVEENEEPTKHLTYRWYGRWQKYFNKRAGREEKQFHVNTFVRCQPHGRAGVISYLMKAPAIKRVLAGRLYDKFQGDAVRILREQPEVAAAACERLGEEGASKAAEWLKQEQAVEGCMIDLVDLLDGRGFPKQVAKQALSRFGNRAADVIKRNPYVLMGFRGCGFKRADALYLDLGKPPTAMKRQAYCAWHAIATNSNGDTWHYVDVLKRSLQGSIGGADVNSERAMAVAVRGKLLSIERTDGVSGPPSWDGDCVWVAEQRKAKNERRLATLINNLMSDESAEWPDCDVLQENLSDHQYENLSNAIVGPVAILGGSPGTGKTYTAANLIKLLVAIYGPERIGVAAPIGKGAVRLTESLSEYGIPLVARTWHSLLGVESNDDGWSFRHHAGNPLPYKVLIGDESSMIDTDLAASIFSAIAPGSLVLLIGDTNQLPPVGHGAPLRDMIAAGLPYGELREIRRNSGAIVDACANIRDGKGFGYGENLRSARPGVQSMLNTISESSQELEINPTWDIQVLCAVNKKSELSRRELNQQLQKHLNPNPMVGGSPFRLNDKVVNTKNGYYPVPEKWADRVDSVDIQTNDDGKVYVANGEIGRVVEAGPKHFVVAMSSPNRVVLVPRGQADEGDGDDGTGTGCNWDLGYALSVHRSQGSEWQVVLVMVDDSPGASRLCTREWVYTAISRAKLRCYLVGNDAIAQQWVKRTSLDKRKTFLSEQLMSLRP